MKDVAEWNEAEERTINKTIKGQTTPSPAANSLRSQPASLTFLAHKIPTPCYATSGSAREAPTWSLTESHRFAPLKMIPLYVLDDQSLNVVKRWVAKKFKVHTFLKQGILL